MELWRDYHGYEVSNHGRIKSKRDHQLMKPYRKQTGCDQIDLFIDGNKKKLKVSKLVALVWLDRPPHKEYDCRHINCNQLDNRVSNLIWVERTPKQTVEKQLWMYAF